MSEAARRSWSVWEDPSDERPELWRFALTTLQVLLRGRKFFRSLTTRRDSPRAYQFARIQWAMASLLLGSAVFLHVIWFTDLGGKIVDPESPRAYYFEGLSVVLVFMCFETTTAIASRLTQWEASYRGLRMPLKAVLRAMYFHSAAYVPVSAAALAAVVSYRLLLTHGWVNELSAPAYLFVLCGLVITSAGYLFVGYWTAMKNIMYPNG